MGCVQARRITALAEIGCESEKWRRLGEACLVPVGGRETRHRFRFRCNLLSERGRVGYVLVLLFLFAYDGRKLNIFWKRVVLPFFTGDNEIFVCCYHLEKIRIPKGSIRPSWHLCIAQGKT